MIECVIFIHSFTFSKNKIIVLPLAGTLDEDREGSSSGRISVTQSRGTKIADIKPCD